MLSSNMALRARPRRLASYIAMSALRISSVASSPGALSAIPTLMLTLRSVPSSEKGCLTDCRTRSATKRASSGSTTSSSSTVNSSPPSRATVSPGRRASATRAASPIRSSSPATVAEAVVDQLEAVDIEEQDGAAGRRMPRAALQRVTDAIKEESAVGKPGERVVEGVVLQSQLRGPAFGDVRQRPRHANGLAVGAAAGQPTDHDPTPAAVGMAHPVLELQVRRAVVQMGGDRVLQPGKILGVNEGKPGLGTILPGLLGLTEDRLPTLREVDPVAHEVPVPDAIIGRPDRQRVTLLAAGQVDRLLVADGVANRAFQAGRVELLLDQVVRYPERAGRKVGLVGGMAGEHDHRGLRPRGKRLADELESGAGAQLVIDQIEVVALLLDRGQRLLIVGLPFHGEPGSRLAAEQVAVIT